MKTKNLILIGILSLSFMVLMSCGESSKAKETDLEKGNIKTVKTVKISEKEIGREIDYSANLLANEEVYFAPATPGRIIKIYPEVGDRVSAGQVLIQMDPTQLNTSKLQLQSLEKDMQRLDTLIQYGGVSQQQYDQMKTQLEVTRANIDLLESNTVMTAPFSGVVTAKYFEDGELYSGAPNTQIGKAAILILQQINPIKAVISVSEKYYPVIKEGLEVNLVSDIYPNETFNGKISLIHPTINAATKTFNIEVKIPNNKQLLRPGMYGRINLEFAKETAMVVPAVAVLQQIGTNRRYVFVHKNGIAEKIDVEVGKRFDDQIEIISKSIKLGDELIVSGHSNLVDEAKVSVVK